MNRARGSTSTLSKSPIDNDEDQQEEEADSSLLASSGTAATTSGGAKVDSIFLKNLIYFLKICIPSLRSKEFLLLIIVASLLGARSYLDLWTSDNGGKVVQAIVGRNKEMFIRRAVVDIGIMMFPMAFVNNSLKYSIARLRIMFRRRLSYYFHDKYLKNNTFYKIVNLDSRIRNVDQLLTVDIERFCTTLSDLYSNLSKPMLDVILFSRRLSRSLGMQGPLFMIGYFALCSLVLTGFQPPFGDLASTEQKLEGEYRLHHSRLIAHSEEVAFYNGGQREKLYINLTFDRVVQHLKTFFGARFRIGFLDSLLVKYIATIVGYMVVSIPVFFTDSYWMRLLNFKKFGGSASGGGRGGSGSGSGSGGMMKDGGSGDGEEESASEIAGLYTRNSRLLLQLAGAIGRLVLAGKEINKLTGYCQRVANLRDVLDDLSHSNAIRKRFESSPDLERDLKLAELMQPGELIVTKAEDGVIDGEDSKGGTSVKFENVHLISPDATVLVEHLTFEIVRGMHLLITGPNGCGKSSLFRVLAGLWPLYGGKLYRPERCRLFYVPQRPYLAMGTLRDQVTYPMTWLEAVEQKGANDESISQLLEDVRLGDLLLRKNGLDAVQDWAEVLSGGQKQRIAFSRLLFHRPDYAILDECTSAVSLDVEGLLYRQAKQAGITLITVSHRPSLWKFHSQLLRFDGNGGYEFRPMQEKDIPALTASAGNDNDNDNNKQ